MNAKAVFGEPIQQGSFTLIPVASVTYGFGSGQGWGRGPKPEGAAEGAATGAPAATENEGAGAGGGGGGMARPLGFVKIDENGATWEPTMDMGRISVAGMFLAGWIVFWLMRLLRALAK